MVVLLKTVINTRLFEKFLKLAPASTMAQYSIMEDGFKLRNYTPGYVAYFEVFIGKELFEEYSIDGSNSDFESSDWTGIGVIDIGTINSVISTIKTPTIELQFTRNLSIIRDQGDEILRVSSLEKKLKTLSLPQSYNAQLKISEKILNQRLKILRKLNNIISFELTESSIFLSGRSKDKVGSSGKDLTAEPSVEYRGCEMSVRIDTREYWDRFIPLLTNSVLDMKFKPNFVVISYSTPQGIRGVFLHTTMSSESH